MHHYILSILKKGEGFIQSLLPSFATLVLVSRATLEAVHCCNTRCIFNCFYIPREYNLFHKCSPFACDNRPLQSHVYYTFFYTIRQNFSNILEISCIQFSRSFLCTIVFDECIYLQGIETPTSLSPKSSSFVMISSLVPQSLTSI